MEECKKFPEYSQHTCYSKLGDFLAGSWNFQKEMIVVEKLKIDVRVD